MKVALINMPFIELYGPIRIVAGRGKGYRLQGKRRIFLLSEALSDFQDFKAHKNI